MNYQARQHSPAVQAYAYASVLLFLVALIVFPLAAIAIAIINVVVLAYSRLA